MELSSRKRGRPSKSQQVTQEAENSAGSEASCEQNSEDSMPHGVKMESSDPVTPPNKPRARSRKTSPDFVSSDQDHMPSTPVSSSRRKGRKPQKISISLDVHENFDNECVVAPRSPQESEHAALLTKSPVQSLIKERAKPDKYAVRKLHTGNGPTKKPKTQPIKGPFTCPHCSEVEQQVSGMKQHMLKIHYRVWSPGNAEGVVNLHQVIKQLKKITCHACEREFNSAQYYQTHLQWCGREDELVSCRVCQLPIKITFVVSHERACQKRLEESQYSPTPSTEPDTSQSQGQSRSKRPAALRASEVFSLTNLVENSDPDDRQRSKKKAVDNEFVCAEDDVTAESDMTPDRPVKPPPKPRPPRRSTGQTPSGTLSRISHPVVWQPTVSLNHDRYLSLDAQPVLPSWRPKPAEWTLLSPSEREEYLPKKGQLSAHFSLTRDSIEATPVIGQGHKDCLSFPESQPIDDGWLCYTGGPIWAMDWCPIPATISTRQYLAVATRRNLLQHTLLESSSTGPSTIQLWNCHKLDLMPDETSIPVLEVVIATDSGSIMDLKWCPFGGRIDLKKGGAAHRLGILAVATSSGHVLILSIPDPSHMCTSGVQKPAVYRVEPSAILTQVMNSVPDSPCMCLGWSVDAGLARLAAGFGDGSISVWDLATTSVLLLGRDEENRLLLQPFITLPAHTKAVFDVEFCPQSHHFLASVSLDRSLRFWDLREPDMPTASFTRTKLHALCWPTYWSGVVIGGDDCYNFGHNAAFMYDNGYNLSFHRPLLTTDSCMWDITYSPWSHSLVSCDSFGTASLIVLPEINQQGLARKGEASVTSRRITLMKTLHSALPCDSTGDDSLETDQANGDDAEKYWLEDWYSNQRLEYHLYTVSKRLSTSKLAVTDSGPDNYRDPPLRSLHKVSFNPNLSSHVWLAAGGQAGILILRSLQQLVTKSSTDLCDKLKVIP